jgi:hypothetical protein
MRLVWSGASEAGIAGIRVASSVRWAIRKDVYDAEAVTQVAEDRDTIEPIRTERVDGPATFDIKVAPPRAGEPGDEDLRLIPVKSVINLLQRGKTA